MHIRIWITFLILKELSLYRSFSDSRRLKHTVHETLLQLKQCTWIQFIFSWHFQAFECACFCNGDVLTPHLFALTLFPFTFGLNATSLGFTLKTGKNQWPIFFPRVLWIIFVEALLSYCDCLLLNICSFWGQRWSCLLLDSPCIAQCWIHNRQQISIWTV